MKCCHVETRSLGGWDDPQETDHAFNLSLCDKCGIIYKEDVWNDAGIRAIRLDGSVVKLITDLKWEESGLLKNLEGELKSIVIDLLRMAELYAHKTALPDRLDTTLFPVVRRMAKKLYDQEGGKELIPLISLDEIRRRYDFIVTTEWYKVEVIEAYLAINAEAELTARLSDEYVEHLIQSAKP